MIEKIMKNDSLEPTNREIIEMMQRGFAYMEERFELVDARIDQRFGLLHDRMNNFEIRLSVVEKKVTSMEIIMLDIQEEFMSLSHAVDKDAEMLISYEKRIGRLEKAR